jgi:hypothetical protein
VSGLAVSRSGEPSKVETGHSSLSETLGSPDSLVLGAELHPLLKEDG